MLNFNDDWRTDPAAQEFMRDFAAVYRTCRRLDLEVGTDGVLNNMCRNPPKEFLATPGPRLTANGLNLCLSAPGCKDYIFREYREIYTRMKALGVKPDYVRFWPYDEGGCCCTNCAPWGGNGYLRLVEDGLRLAREFFPEVKSRVSMWWFTPADGEAFRRRLATDGLLAVDDTIGNYGISGDNRFTNLWDTARQGKPLRQITFPEISMHGRRPWGGSGANPTPRRLVKSMRDGWCRSDGFSLYSEGCYEDIDKALLVRLYTDRSATAEDVLREYARFEFPGADEEKCAKLLLLLEENWNIGWPLRFIQKASDGERADFVRVSSAALALMEEIRSGLLPSARACWRWRLVEIRCRLDDELARERRLDTPMALALLKELVDMYHAEEIKGTYNDPQHGLLRPPYDPPNRPREKLSAERLREIEVLSGGK